MGGWERAERVWTGSLQLVAGDPVPAARPSDGGEERGLDAQARTPQGSSPGRGCLLGRARAGARLRPRQRSRAAGRSRARRRPEDAGRADPQLADCGSPVRSAQDRLTALPGTLPWARTGPAGGEDAHLPWPGSCGPRLCADSGPGGRPCRACAAGARPAAPGSSPPGWRWKRALNSTTSEPPPGSSPGPRSAAAADCTQERSRAARLPSPAAPRPALRRA